MSRNDAQLSYNRQLTRRINKYSTEKQLFKFTIILERFADEIGGTSIAMRDSKEALTLKVIRGGK